MNISPKKNRKDNWSTLGVDPFYFEKLTRLATIRRRDKIDILRDLLDAEFKRLGIKDLEAQT